MLQLERILNLIDELTLYKKCIFCYILTLHIIRKTQNILNAQKMSLYIYQYNLSIPIC